MHDFQHISRLYLLDIGIKQGYFVKKALEEIIEAHWNKILSIKKAPEYIKWRLQLSYLEDLKEKIKSAEDEKMFLKAFELDEFIK